MASSNRHWPSMFKSKPHHHDIIPSACRSGPYATSVLGCEERSPEPKPRWNPKPEQIRILEAIFNSGMVNPPRDEISKIRAQLQEYGQVGDANVFYWFQNRKSRSKHKNRHHLSKTNTTHTTSSTPATTINPSSAVVATSSSSSSSEKPSPRGSSKRKAGGGSSSGFTGGSSSSSTKLYMDVVGTNSNSPTGSVNQSGNYFNHNNNNDHFIQPEPYFFPVQQSGAIASGVFGGPNELFFSELHGGGGGVECGGTGLQENMNNGLDGNNNNNNNGIHGGGFSGLLLGEMIGGSKKDERDDDLGKFRFHQEFGFFATSPLSSECLNVAPQLSSSTTTATANMMLASFSQGQGGGDPGLLLGQSPSTIVAPAKSTVFINDVAFEVPAGAFNVRDAFGEDAVLVHCSGQPVLTDDWGLTSLQHGGFYYLVRTLPSGGPVYGKNEGTTADLLLQPDQFPFHL